jgi:AraC family transcriptional regulator of adaptative response/methylated-DNA-[protein]-cysteine methyltransferase
MEHRIIDIEEIVQKKIYYGVVKTTFGATLIGFNANNIFWLSFSNNIEQMKSCFNNFEFIEDDTTADTLIKEIFQNNTNNFFLILKGTSFQKQVLKELISIKVGKTTTYQDIANGINKPKAVRAVASAIGKNNIAYLIPCHRVIGKDGKLRGYRWGIDIKKALLEYEGLK